MRDPEKQRAAKRRHYERNTERYKAHAKEAQRQLREEVQRLKERPCTDCGETYPYYVMQFDHRPGEEKVGHVSRLVQLGSRPKVLAEIAKCDVVCSNCHAVRTYRRTTPS